MFSCFAIFEILSTCIISIIACIQGRWSHLWWILLILLINLLAIKFSVGKDKDK